MPNRFSILGRYPTTRLRRNRREEWSRRLVAEWPADPVRGAGDVPCLHPALPGLPQSSEVWLLGVDLGLRVHVGPHVARPSRRPGRGNVRIPSVPYAPPPLPLALPWPARRLNCFS